MQCVFTFPRRVRSTNVIIAGRLAEWHEPHEERFTADDEGEAERIARGFLVINGVREGELLLSLHRSIYIRL